MNRKRGIHMLVRLFIYPTKTVFFTYLILYLILCGIELYFAFVEKEKARKIIKPFCVLSLTLFALLTFPDAYLIWLGLLFGVIGDVFFIFKDKQKCVYLGMASFLINHLLFITQVILLVRSATSIRPLHIIIFAIVYGLLLVVGFLALRKAVKISLPLSIAGTGYLTFLCLDMGVQIYASAIGQRYLLCGVIGGLLFILSDSILSYTMFIKDIKRRDFPIMATYLSAQALIAVGLILQLMNSSLLR